MIEKDFFTERGFSIELIKIWEGRETPDTYLYSKRFIGKTPKGTPFEMYFEYFINHSVRLLDFRFHNQKYLAYKYYPEADKTWLQRLFSKTTNNLTPYFNHLVKNKKLDWVELMKEEGSYYLYFGFHRMIRLQIDAANVLSFIQEIEENFE